MERKKPDSPASALRLSFKARFRSPAAAIVVVIVIIVIAIVVPIIIAVVVPVVIPVVIPIVVPIVVPIIVVVRTRRSSDQRERCDGEDLSKPLAPSQVHESSFGSGERNRSAVLILQEMGFFVFWEIVCRMRKMKPNMMKPDAAFGIVR